MKTILFLFLLAPLFSFAQTDAKDQLWPLPKADSNCKPVLLPELRRSDFYKIYEVGMYSSYQYKITHDSTYRKIFARHLDSLPAFDFKKQELIANLYCIFCRRISNDDNQPRHRNACSYNVFWCVRKIRN